MTTLNETVRYIIQLYEYIYYVGYKLFYEIYQDHFNTSTYAGGLLFLLVGYIIMIPMTHFTVLLGVNLSFGYYAIGSIVFMVVTAKYFSIEKCKEVTKYFDSQPNNNRYKYGLFLLLILSSVFWFLPR